MAAVKPNVEGMEVTKNFALIPPENIVVDAKMNSRRVKAENVDRMVRSYEQPVVAGGTPRGQDTPVKVVLQDDGSVKLVYGYTRHAAALKYNKKNAERPMKLKCEIVQGMDEASAYVTSVVENNSRTDPSPVELADQCKTLLEVYGKSEREVADIFGKPGSDGIEWVRWIQKLLGLPKEVRDMVTAKELPAVAAIELVGLEEKDVKDILKKAERFGPNNRIKGESVRRAAKSRKSGKSAEESAEASGTQPVSRKGIYEFFANLTGPGEDPEVKTLATKLRDFLDGKIGLEKAEEWFRKLGGAIEENKDAKKAAKAKEEEPPLDDEPAAAKKPAAKKGKKGGGKGKKNAPAASAAAPSDEPPLDDEPALAAAGPEVVKD
jgi:hypothetical protein